MTVYCPNCAASIEPASARCDKCGAIFGGDSAWIPTDKPPGPPSLTKWRYTVVALGVVITLFWLAVAHGNAKLTVLPLTSGGITIACCFAGGRLAVPVLWAGSLAAGATLLFVLFAIMMWPD